VPPCNSVVNPLSPKEFTTLPLCGMEARSILRQGYGWPGENWRRWHSQRVYEQLAVARDGRERSERQFERPPEKDVRSNFHHCWVEQDRSLNQF
jgi:hypothetical protein